MGKLICRKCGKEIKGIILTYSFSGKWECSECNKKNILCSEEGCKVKVTNLNGGHSYDYEHAKKYLEQDKIYEVKSLEIEMFNSILALKEIPNINFNAAHFERCT